MILKKRNIRALIYDFPFETWNCSYTGTEGDKAAGESAD